jgi:hypothetical protein
MNISSTDTSKHVKLILLEYLSLYKFIQLSKLFSFNLFMFFSLLNLKSNQPPLNNSQNFKHNL